MLSKPISTVISIERVSKMYRLGEIGSGTFREDFERRWARLRGKPDPNAKLGQSPQASHSEGKIWALRDIDVQIRQGESVGIIGPNGAGKSTLLKILSRLTAPTSGEIRIRGQIASLLEAGVGFHPELTGRENIFLSGSILGMSRREILRAFDAIVDFAEIADFIDTPVKRYSTGMHVRLGFAVAAHLNAEILLIDEVLAVGDLSFQRKCLRRIEALRREGRTNLLITHNVQILPGMASRVVWLDAGSVQADGDPQTVVLDYIRRMSNTISSQSAATEYASRSIPVPEGELICHPPQGQYGVRLIRACVSDEHFRSQSRVDYEQPFLFIAEYEVDEPVEGLRIGFYFYNEHQQAVIRADTSTSSGFLEDRVLGSPGRHRVYTTLPKHWFAPGAYWAQVCLWAPPAIWHFNKENAFVFHIVNCPFLRIGTESSLPQLEWHGENL